MKIFKCASLIFIALLLLALLPVLLVFRKYLQYRITKNRNNRLHDGINILEPITIGGIQQWISVRGENKDNPILLFIHGGPGMSMMPLSFIFDPLEAHFTIVNWDQRGTGKTYTANRKAPLSGLTVNQMHADTLEVVSYLRQRFQKEKIFVMGASWGSILGLKLAQDHPELLYAYIGFGQAINIKENEQMGYENTLKIAYDRKNKKAIEALENLASFRNKDLNNVKIREFHVLRKWEGVSLSV